MKENNFFPSVIPLMLVYLNNNENRKSIKICKKTACLLLQSVNRFPQSHVWKDQNNLGQLPTNQSLASLPLEFLLYGSSIPLTLANDRDRIFPDSIVINTVSTRYVIRMSKNVKFIRGLLLDSIPIFRSIPA